MRINRTPAAFVAAVLALLLGACGPGSGESVANKVKRAEAMAPSDAGLAEKYERSCRICHVSPDSGAPLAGDAIAWKPRLAQDKTVLATHLRDGLKAMPPRGQCFDCTDGELDALTRFMSTGAPKGAPTP